jgi:hypothetical protein
MSLLPYALLSFPAAALALAIALARRLPAEDRPVLALALALLVASALLSPVVPRHDPWTHYLHLRATLEDPLRVLDLWDRPGFTLLAAGPAAFGIRAARLAAVATALVTLAATMGAARALGLARPWAAGLLVLAQYDFFGQGASTMTELPFAAALAIALLGWAEGRPWLVAAGLGWAGIVRPEGPAFAALGALAILLRWRRPLPALAAGVPFVLYVAAGALVFRDPLWMASMNPYRGHLALVLDPGRLLRSYFFTALVLSQGPALVFLEAAGAGLAIAGPERRLRSVLAPLAITFLLLTFVGIGDTEAWRESRYLVSVAPALGLLAAAALDALLARLPRVAPTALLALAGWAGWRVVRYHWAAAGAAPNVAAVAVAGAVVVLVAVLLLLRGRISPAAAFCTVLVATVASVPPGSLGRHREVLPGYGDDQARPPVSTPSTISRHIGSRRS